MKIQDYLIIALIVVLAVLFVPTLKGNLGASSGTTHSNVEEFLAGLSVGERGTTLYDKQCATLSWNPSSLAVNATTSQAVALQGAAVGDICNANIATTTAGNVRVSCSITASAASESTYGTSTVLVQNLGGAIDFNDTLRVCYEGY
jgi:hypothetical protein